jgi:hypothetical protein
VVFAAVSGTATITATAATALPKAPTSFQTTARDLTIAPRSILVSEDGNAPIWGPGSRGFKGEDHFPREPAIRWTQWGARAALAAGALVQGTCTPSCGQGTFDTYPISIKMWRPGVVHGQRIFTRLSYTFLTDRPSRVPHTVLATATYEPATTAYGGSPAHWGWDPRF